MRQLDVLKDVSKQLAADNTSIIGVMLESNIEEKKEGTSGKRWVWIDSNSHHQKLKSKFGKKRLSR